MEYWENKISNGFLIISLSLCPLRSLRPPSMKKKSTAEYAETAELFIGKDRNTNHFMKMDSSLPFDPPGMKARG